MPRKKTQKEIQPIFSEDYIRGLESGKKHATPSPHTIEMIDTINKKLEDIMEILKKQDERSNEFRQFTKEHMERVEPVIKKFEEDKALYDGAKNLGNKITFWAKVITAIGVIGLGIKYVLMGVVTK